ncbi:MAG: hypothetical protein V4795_09955 [Pseudomonadota bacterium]
MKHVAHTLSIVLASVLASTPALAAPQTFVSGATKGSMDEFSRITLVRDCSDIANAPHLKCSKQDITVKDKTGKVTGKFPDNELAKGAGGLQKFNLAKVFVIDEDEGGGNGARYFYFRFVPQDSADIDVMANGQMFPKYYEVITDMNLKPIKAMRLSASGAAAKWVEVKRQASAKKVKAQEIESPLRVADYLVVMEDR